jgi:phosphoribosylformimino-5-aminoimidazole carboxamide ribotide isomerase
MQIIPVIDIKDGQAVLAKQGDRNNYQALSTPLCASSDINTVINAYLSIWPFTQFYIADLNALMGTGNNNSLINSTFIRFPQLNFIIDCGQLNRFFSPVRTTQYTAIISTESVDMHTLTKINQQANEFILSLDFSAQDTPLGDTSLYTVSHLWPKKLIIMSLGLVGSKNGPDFLKLKRYVTDYPEHNIIAAGGIRDSTDLKQLKAIGIKQALVATALHNGKLMTNDMNELRNENLITL